MASEYSFSAGDAQLLRRQQFYLALYLVAPVPRTPLPLEKKYVHIGSHGNLQDPEDLPCWQDKWTAQKKSNGQVGNPSETEIEIEKAEIFMSLVVPAYNEEERLGAMLSEATDYLQREYGDGQPLKHANGSAKKRANGHTAEERPVNKGWEVLVVSDGSTDKTIDTALQCARDIGGKAAVNVRVIHLEENRGKGGAVVHGMRHVRGQYAVFADADGASKFEDLGKLVRECRRVLDRKGRAVAVGSRAHLVGSEAVVKVWTFSRRSDSWLTTTHRGLLCATSSCTHFISSSAFLLLLRRQQSGIRSVGSSCSRGLLFRTLYRICTQKGGYLTWRC